MDNNSETDDIRQSAGDSGVTPDGGGVDGAAAVGGDAENDGAGGGVADAVGVDGDGTAADAVGKKKDVSIPILRTFDNDHERLARSKGGAELRSLLAKEMEKKKIAQEDYRREVRNLMKESAYLKERQARSEKVPADSGPWEEPGGDMSGELPTGLSEEDTLSRSIVGATDYMERAHPHAAAENESGAMYAVRVGGGDGGGLPAGADGGGPSGDSGGGPQFYEKKKERFGFIRRLFGKKKRGESADSVAMVGGEMPADGGVGGGDIPTADVGVPAADGGDVPIVDAGTADAEVPVGGTIGGMSAADTGTADGVGAGGVSAAAASGGGGDMPSGDGSGGGTDGDADGGVGGVGVPTGGVGVGAAGGGGAGMPSGGVGGIGAVGGGAAGGGVGGIGAVGGGAAGGMNVPAGGGAEVLTEEEKQSRKHASIFDRIRGVRRAEKVFTREERKEMKKQQEEIVKKESMRDAWNEFLVKKEKVREQGLKARDVRSYGIKEPKVRVFKMRSIAAIFLLLLILGCLVVAVISIALRPVEMPGLITPEELKPMPDVVSSEDRVLIDILSNPDDWVSVSRSRNSRNIVTQFIPYMDRGEGSEQITLREFISVFEMGIPDSLYDSLHDYYFVGNYTTGSLANGVLVLSVKNYGDALVWMLNWENDAINAFAGVFPDGRFRPSQPGTTSVTPKIIDNKDVRILRNPESSGQLLYYFYNRSLLVFIAGEEEVVSIINNRIRSANAR